MTPKSEGDDSLRERKVGDAGVCVCLHDVRVLISHLGEWKYSTHLVGLMLNRDDMVLEGILAVDLRRGSEKGKLFFVHLVEPLRIVKSMCGCQRLRPRRLDGGDQGRDVRHSTEEIGDTGWAVLQSCLSQAHCRGLNTHMLDMLQGEMRQAFVERRYLTPLAFGKLKVREFYDL